MGKRSCKITAVWPARDQPAESGTRWWKFEEEEKMEQMVPYRFMYHMNYWTVLKKKKKKLTVLRSIRKFESDLVIRK